MVRDPENSIGTIYSIAAELLSAWAHHSVVGRLISARWLCRRAAQRAHGAASASHVGGSSSAVAWLAGCSASARTAGVDTQTCAVPASAPSNAPRSGTLAHFTGGSMASDERYLYWLACARGLRLRSYTRTLARVRARVFSRELARILVVRRPAMAVPAAVEYLGTVVVPAFGGPREHGDLCLSRVLRSTRLCLLPQPAESFSCFAALGSDSGSGHHVGRRFIRFPHPSGVDHVQVPTGTVCAHGGVLTSLA